jgi:hypothetical protein
LHESSGPDAAPGEFKAISMSDLAPRVCAIDADDSISCWGDDPGGAMSGPDAASGRFKAVSVGGFHTCAIDFSDSISCWGQDSAHQTSFPDAAPGAFGIPGGTLDISHPSPPAGDTSPPETSIVFALKHPNPKSSVFVFESSEPGSAFSCQIDARASEACSSPKRYPRLKPGRHTFSVFATDRAGNADPTPATTRVRVPGKKRRH